MAVLHNPVVQPIDNRCRQTCEPRQFGSSYPSPSRWTLDFNGESSDPFDGYMLWTFTRTWSFAGCLDDVRAAGRWHEMPLPPKSVYLGSRRTSLLTATMGRSTTVTGDPFLSNPAASSAKEAFCEATEKHVDDVAGNQVTFTFRPKNTVKGAACFQISVCSLPSRIVNALPAVSADRETDHARCWHDHPGACCHDLLSRFALHSLCIII